MIARKSSKGSGTPVLCGIPYLYLNFDLPCWSVYSSRHTVCKTLSQLCAGNADCTLDALLAGEEVGQATLDGQAEDRAYQEEVAGKCADGGGGLGLVGFSFQFACSSQISTVCSMGDLVCVEKICIKSSFLTLNTCGTRIAWMVHRCSRWR